MKQYQLSESAKRFKSTEYTIWQGFRQRCNNPRHWAYYRYGGRGISICERWDKFENFLADMGKRPSLKHTIDRIDNNGNYEPGNCRWATRMEQGNNKCNNAFIEHQGQFKTKPQWSREKNISLSTINRHLKNGKTLAEIFEIYKDGYPKRPCAKLTDEQVLFIRENFKKMLQIQLARMYGVCSQTIHKVVNNKSYRA